ncbi:hypothetical protein H257_18473 [Aphanomyces astaci]|uniref:Uncharacterized protein n=1 Tax=Aphanomyces astaci TaxID=112090 RepID=W4FB25_APHAT|nr:hypothetical protein H257_18473 [Aphanomyces astaci]ETV64700.1 hypothetical protein H257_18473 [Aphanomyces astaci]|eukprot:XP_009845835.1 hypothetical protein H257_18473 [Aphanomyces astaci]
MLFGWLRALPWKRCSTAAVAATASRRLNAITTTNVAATISSTLATAAGCNNDATSTRDLFESISRLELRSMLNRLEHNWSVYHQQKNLPMQPQRLSATYSTDSECASYVHEEFDSLDQEQSVASEWV